MKSDEVKPTSDARMKLKNINTFFHYFRLSPLDPQQSDGPGPLTLVLDLRPQFETHRILHLHFCTSNPPMTN